MRKEFFFFKKQHYSHLISIRIMKFSSPLNVLVEVLSLEKQNSTNELARWMIEMLFVENKFPVKLCWHRKYFAMNKPQNFRTIFSSVGKVIMEWYFHFAIPFYSAPGNWMFKMLNQIVDIIYKAFKWLCKFFKYKICWKIILNLQW